MPWYHLLYVGPLSLTAEVHVRLLLVSACIYLIISEVKPEVKEVWRNFFFLCLSEIVTRGQLMVVEEYKNKIEFLVGTGMLKINNLKRTDSGQYIVESYDTNGRRKDIYFNLQVKGKFNIVHANLCAYFFC
ncbi:hypothetical protein ILYODFUR_028790 [Ilyodon furcidens]|uniref:Uncharacterized protein n=1 Tax=Ilyodon furcidens TaxID=33524 RepID=A0ABV0V7W0_9TELE